MENGSGDRETAKLLAEQFSSLEMTLREYMDFAIRQQEKNQSANSNSQTMTIDAGGPAVWFAVWIATVCCAVMLTLSMVSRADQIDQKRRLDVANDKLSVILQWAPELAKKVDAQVTKQEKGR